MFLINFIAVKKLENIANKFCVDLIHTNIGPSHIGFMTAKKMGIPHVWHIREYQDFDFDMHPIPSMNNLKRKLRYSNNHTIAITHSIFNHFDLQSNACVIYDGVMKKEQIRFEVNKEKFFLFVGRLAEVKGIRQLIEAFNEFAKYNNDYKLYIAGTGEDLFVSELHQIVKGSGFDKRIHFLGFRNDIYNLMAQATALIVPSRCEGFGFITVEAMFNGCLVIGNNSGGTQEILDKENLGILYSGQHELVMALKSVVLKGIENYFPMIKKAQEQAVALYTQEQNVSNIYKYYIKILYQKT